MQYVVVVHREEDGRYWAEVPTLPGCLAQGDTLEAALADVRLAIAAHIAALKLDGQPVPTEGRLLITTVDISADAA